MDRITCVSRLGLSSDFQGDAYYNLLISYRRTWLNSLVAEWRTDLQLGRTSSLVSELYQPLTPEQFFFIAPRFGLERCSVDLYQGNDPIASYDLGSGMMGLDIGAQFKQYGELRFGLMRGELRPKLDTGPERLSPGASHVAQGAYTSRLILDQLDSVDISAFRLACRGEFVRFGHTSRPPISPTPSGTPTEMPSIRWAIIRSTSP